MIVNKIKFVIIKSIKKWIQYIMIEEVSKVVVYPRIHMFSLDLSLFNGNMKSGSMGCSLLNLPIIINVKTSKKNDIVKLAFNNLDLKIEKIICDFRKREKTNNYYDINIKTPDILRPHIGLGLSSSICAGVVRALYGLEKIQFDVNVLLRYRVGTRSACSSRLSLDPGFIMEYGYDISEDGVCLHKELYSYKEKFSKELIKILNCRWYMIVGIPKRIQSISNKIEDDFWNEYYPDNIENTLRINYYISQMILPALWNNNFKLFIKGMSEITHIGTKIIEESIQPAETKKCLELLRKELGFASVSSLGPTIYSFCDDIKYELPSDSEYSFFKIPLWECR